MVEERLPGGRRLGGEGSPALASAPTRRASRNSSGRNVVRRCSWMGGLAPRGAQEVAAGTTGLLVLEAVGDHDADRADRRRCRLAQRSAFAALVPALAGATPRGAPRNASAEFLSRARRMAAGHDDRYAAGRPSPPFQARSAQRRRRARPGVGRRDGRGQRPATSPPSSCGALRERQLGMTTTTQPADRRRRSGFAPRSAVAAPLRRAPRTAR
jgi:hypothetical protein